MNKYITSPVQKRLQKLILSVVSQSFTDFSTGGCTPFYSPVEWKAKGEEYGLNSRLIVVYDGGDLRHFFSYQSEATSLVQRMSEALNEAGYWAEPCTVWYSAIYKLKDK
jgi:hypothetical protein